MFPVEAIIPAIRDSLARNRSVVLSAPPGSGKTTCVPSALLNEPWLKGKKIVVLEPRRLAARACATFIARKLGESVGETVGYQVRLERKVSERTRLEVITEGLLTQRLLADPELRDTGLIIFDEFHERSLTCDLGYALALDVRRALREDLRLLVMSATLDTAAIAAHLADADIHAASARMFPIQTRYLEVESHAPIAAQMAGAVRRMQTETSGSILCFLPGEGEIKRCAEELRDVPHVYPLYGALPKESQDAAIAPAAARKIVLATSIAETSLTIPGVTVVIDCGLMRVKRFSPASGMSRLETLRLTRDRAEQRQGRAGRVAPGICLRLWTLAQDRLLLPAMKPEILEQDLTPTVLAAAQWGTTDFTTIPFLTPPPAGTWQSAKELLILLGALDKTGHITEKGKAMARIPAHPRLANMMLETGETDLAAIIEEGAPHGITDIREVRLTPRMRELSRRWKALLPHSHTSTSTSTSTSTFALAFAFPDRIGRNRGNGTFQLSGGRGAYLERTEALSAAEYLVCCDLDDRGGDARIHLAAPISGAEVEEIFANQIVEEDTCAWNRRTDSIRALHVRRLGRMILNEKPSAQSVDDDERAQALCEALRIKGVALLPCWTPNLRQLQARIQFLHRVLGAPWPDVSDEALKEHAAEWIVPFATGVTRWAHFEKLDLAAVFDLALSEVNLDRHQLDRLAPRTMEVPSGSSMVVHYEEDEPFVQVRLQECFGLMETPKVAEGRIPIKMKLLSPAQRPIQITKDLANFWREGYPLVRKDMRGRYPKHYWPEDPFTAIATRRIRPK